MKKIYKSIIYLLGMLVLGLLAYATIDEPDTNEYVKATYTVNGTTAGFSYSACTGNMTNVTVDYRTSGGSSYTRIGYNTSVTNITGNWQVTGWNTKLLLDDTAYSLRVRYYDNNSNNSLCGTETEVAFNIDNTIPVLTLVSPTDDSTDTDGSVDFSMTCVNTSSATLTREGYYSYTMTESSDSCTLTITDLTNSKQSWYITASDGLNSTTGLTYTVNIVRSGGMLVDAQGQIIQPTTTVTQQKGIKGFIEFLISIPLKILGSIFSVFK